MPRLEASRRSVAGEAFGAVLLNVRGGFRGSSGALRPHYVLIAKTRMELLEDSGRRRRCPHRGLMAFWSLVAAERTLHNIAWTIDPEPAFEELRDHRLLPVRAWGVLARRRARPRGAGTRLGAGSRPRGRTLEHGQPPTLTEVAPDEQPGL